MRKIIYSQMVSVDGFIEDPEGSIDWSVPGEELHRHFNSLEANIDLHLYGRKMYEVMEYWRTADKDPSSSDYEVEYALLWQQTETIVFSTTLEKVNGKAQLKREVNPTDILKLKQEEGKNIDVGGAELASHFIKANLIDEINLYIHPVILGGGKPMFPTLKERLQLHPNECRTFECGVTMLSFDLNTGTEAPDILIKQAQSKP